jgi:hypothetical protein
MPEYTVYREYPAGNWNIAGTTTALTWSDTLPPGNKVVRYKVSTSDTLITAIGAVACQSSSNIAKLLVNIGLEAHDHNRYDAWTKHPQPGTTNRPPFRISLPEAGEVFLIVQDIHGKTVNKAGFTSSQWWREHDSPRSFRICPEDLQLLAALSGCSARQNYGGRIKLMVIKVLYANEYVFDIYSA